MNENGVDDELRSIGLDPDAVAERGCKLLRGLIERGNKTVPQAMVERLSEAVPGLDASALRVAMASDARSLAEFELEQLDVMIRDIWQVKTGSREFEPPMNRIRALGRIRDGFVSTLIKRPDEPRPPARLPLGIVRDDS